MWRADSCAPWGPLWAGLLIVALVAPARGQEARAVEQKPIPFFRVTTMSPDTVNRKVTNPVTDVWTLQLQNDTVLFAGSLPTADEQVGNLFQIAPSIPFRIPWTKNYHLANQLSLPVVTAPSPRVSPTSFSFDEVTGFGDIVMTNYLSRKLKKDEGAVFGLGPTWIFPSASRTATGFGKYQVGPAALVGYFGDRAPLWGYLSAQQFWSIGGDADRPNTNAAAFQYFYQVNVDYLQGVDLPGGDWAIAAAPVITANWRADGGDVWSVPLGTGVSNLAYLGPMPIRSAFEFDYFVARPDRIGQEWLFRFNLTLYVAPARFVNEWLP